VHVEILFFSEEKIQRPKESSAFRGQSAPSGQNRERANRRRQGTGGKILKSSSLWVCLKTSVTEIFEKIKRG